MNKNVSISLFVIYGLVLFVLTIRVSSLDVIEKKIQIVQIPFSEEIKAVEGIITTTEVYKTSNNNVSFSLKPDTQYNKLPISLSCMSSLDVKLTVNQKASVKITRYGACILIGLG